MLFLGFSENLTLSEPVDEVAGRLRMPSKVQLRSSSAGKALSLETTGINDEFKRGYQVEEI